MLPLLWCRNTYAGLPLVLEPDPQQNQAGMSWPANFLSGQAPPLNVRILDRSGNLPSDYINHIFKDQAGLIWVCTNKGVFYLLPWSDVRKFGQAEGLAHQTVLQMAQTTDGWEYLACAEGGLLSFNGNSFAPMLSQYMDRKTIRSMAADQANNLFMLVDNHLGYMDSSKTWNLLTPLPTLDGAKLFPLPDGTMALAQGNKLSLYRAGPRGRVKLSTTLFVQGDAGLLKPIAHADGYLLYSIGNDVHIYRYAAGKLLFESELKGLGRHLQTAARTHDGRWYLGYSDRGMALVERNQVYAYHNRNYLTGNDIKQLMIDNEGALWVGTYGNGLLHVSESYLQIYHKEDGLDEHIVQKVAGTPSGSTIVATTSAGFFVMREHAIQQVNDTSLTNLRAISFADEQTAFVPNDRGVFKLTLPPATRQPGSVTSKILFNVAVQRLPVPGARAIICFQANEANANNTITTQPLPLGKPQVWIATQQGKVVVLQQDQVHHTFSLPAGFRIERLTKTGEHVWALTDDGQAMAYTTEGLVVRQLSRKQGLPITTINDVDEDQEGNLFLATDSGLYSLPAGSVKAKRITPEKGSIHCLGMYRGKRIALTDKLLYLQQDTGWLRCNSFKPMSNEKAAINMADFLPESGLLLIAATKGFAVANLNQWRPVQGRFMLVGLEGSAANQKLRMFSTANPEDKIYRFHEGLDLLRLRFQITDYNCNGDVRFYITAVKDGDTSRSSTVGKEWSIVKPEPGQYSISVVGMGQDGIRSSNALHFNFTILPAWYKQGWFIYLMTILGLSLIWLSAKGYSSYLYRQKMRELQLVQRIQAERERISRDLHDNVGSQLVYMVNALEQVKRQVPVVAKPAEEASPEVGKLNDKLQEVATLARTTIQNLRESIWVLHQGGEIELLNFVERIRRYLDQVKAIAHVKVHEHVDLAPNGKLTPVQALNLFRMVQEAVTNAVRHSQALEFDLHISWQGSQLDITVADAGTGFNPERGAQTESYGLKNMEHRAQEIQATLEVKSALGKGTRVHISMPLASELS